MGWSKWWRTWNVYYSLCGYSDAYKLVKETKSIEPQAGDNLNNNNKEVVLKNCASFTGCISDINNTKTDNAKDIDVFMPIYNLIEHRDNYSKRSGILWKYYRDKLFLDNNDDVANFSVATNNGASFKFRQKINTWNNW